MESYAYLVAPILAPSLIDEFTKLCMDDSDELVLTKFNRDVAWQYSCEYLAGDSESFFFVCDLDVAECSDPLNTQEYGPSYVLLHDFECDDTCIRMSALQKLASPEVMSSAEKWLRDNFVTEKQIRPADMQRYLSNPKNTRIFRAVEHILGEPTLILGATH